MTELDPAKMIKIDTEEEPNQTGKIMSTDDVVVKDVHDDNLDDNLDNDNADYRSAMGVDIIYTHRNMSRQEY